MEWARIVACWGVLAAAALAGALMPAVSAAPLVDLGFAFSPGEDSTCRQWSGTGSVVWNLSLAMTGDETSLLTTATYVWINDSRAPAMQNDAWTVVITASGDQAATPPSYDSLNSNELAIGSGVFAPGPGTVDLALFSANHTPAAPATNITLQITPSRDSENKAHNFSIVATTHRTGVPNVTRAVPLCVHIPSYPRFEVGNFTSTLYSAADNDISVSFWLKNTGNTQDWYYCNVSVPRNGWTWSFQQGINIGPNITNLTNIGQNLTIRVRVHVPWSAVAGENSTVALNCSSVKAGPTLFPYAPYTRVEIPQYFYVKGTIVGDATRCALPGEAVTFQILVENLGNGPDRGALRLVAPSNMSWQTLLTPEEVDLAAAFEEGYNATASLTVTIPEGALLFTYDFYVNVTSSPPGPYPVTRLRFHVCVRQVYVPVVSQPGPESALPGDQVVFSLTIGNDGNGLDALLIDVYNLSGWQVLLSPPIGEKLLQVGEEAAFQITVVVPPDALAGVHNQTVRVSSKYANLDHGVQISADARLSVVVGQTCGASLGPDSTLWTVVRGANANESLEIPFVLNLTNSGNTGADFSLTIAGAAVLLPRIVPDQVALEPFASARATLTVSIPRELPAGTYVVLARASSSCNVTVSDQASIDVSLLPAAAAVGGDYTIRVGLPPNAPASGPSLRSGGSFERLEGTNLSFFFNLVNVGNQTIPARTPLLWGDDELECPPGLALDACAPRVVWSFEIAQPLPPGASLRVEFVYIVPDVVHWASGGPELANNHTLMFYIPPGSYAGSADTIEARVRAREAPPPVEISGGNGTNSTENITGNPPPVTAPNPTAAVAAVGAVAAATAVTALYALRRRSRP